MVLDRWVLARSGLDRHAQRRGEEGLIEALWSSPGTRVLLIHQGQAPVAGEHGELVLLSPGDVAAALADTQRAEISLRAYLGASDHLEYLLAEVTLPTEGVLHDDSDPIPALAGVQRWAGLREVGALLSQADAALLTPAVALANWHRTHPRCSRCGAETQVVQAGWARRCPQCQAEHYPRTDPAVIMSVIDADGRILLGRQAVWPERRYSTLAGFVEPGESLEAAVRREVAEEAGIQVGSVEYLASQPWPFPASLMLGFRADAESIDIALVDSELQDARWWTRAEFTRDIATGELLLPSPVSIARRLIEDWYGAEITQPDSWR